MSETKRIAEALRVRTERLIRSPAAARVYLISLGVYTEDGELHPNYGGAELPVPALFPASDITRGQG